MSGLSLFALSDIPYWYETLDWRSIRAVGITCKGFRLIVDKLMSHHAKMGCRYIHRAQQKIVGDIVDRLSQLSLDKSSDSLNVQFYPHMSRKLILCRLAQQYSRDGICIIVMWKSELESWKNKMTSFFHNYVRTKIRDRQILLPSAATHAYVQHASPSDLRGKTIIVVNNSQDPYKRLFGCAKDQHTPNIKLTITLGDIMYNPSSASICTKYVYKMPVSFVKDLLRIKNPLKTKPCVSARIINYSSYDDLLQQWLLNKHELDKYKRAVVRTFYVNVLEFPSLLYPRDYKTYKQRGGILLCDSLWDERILHNCDHLILIMDAMDQDDVFSMAWEIHKCASHDVHITCYANIGKFTNKALSQLCLIDVDYHDNYAQPKRDAIMGMGIDKFMLLPKFDRYCIITAQNKNVLGTM